tara:strand:+ start:5430 stop:5639 length:210 start_codon:yes stop_codon:yes gene_type:complete
MKLDTKNYTKAQLVHLETCEEVESLIQIVRMMKKEMKYSIRYISHEKLDSIQQYVYKLKYYIKNQNNGK